MISLPRDEKDLNAGGWSFGCRKALEEQPPDLPPAVCGRGQPSAGRRDGEGSCTEPGSRQPPGGSWRDMEHHAAPAVSAMCGRSTLAVCSGFRKQQGFDSLGRAHLRFFLASSFLCANHVPPARGLCCHCWLLVPLASAYCICFDLLGLAFSHPFAFIVRF